MRGLTTVCGIVAEGFIPFVLHSCPLQKGGTLVHLVLVHVGFCDALLFNTASSRPDPSRQSSPSARGEVFCSFL